MFLNARYLEKLGVHNPCSVACSARSSTCHGACEDYLNYTVKKKKVYREYQKASKREKEATAYSVNCIEKARNNQPKWKMKVRQHG